MTYTKYYAGPGGASGNSGLSYALRKLTLSQVEAILSAATRATVLCAPGTYRETLTLAVSGPAPYVTGTVSVTAGSKIVTGSGTSWLANAELNDYFQVLQFAHGTDGVTNGTSTFTSAAGNFQSGHVGMTIRIDSKVAGIITTVTNAQTVTLKDTAGTDLTPSAGSGLTYDVGPSGPVKLASVDSNTQFTLAAAWDFPTLTGLSYQVWGHIEYVGDYGGQLTDGVGGVCRITGSDDDKVATRANCITATSKNQRSFSGFQADLTTTFNAFLNFTSAQNFVVSACAFMSGMAGGPGIAFLGAGQLGNSIINCFFFTCSTNLSPISITHSAVLSNIATSVINCLVLGGSSSSSSDPVLVQRVGGITVRNCTLLGTGTNGAAGCVHVSIALTVGQAVTVNNCILGGGAKGGLSATVVGEVLGDYNNLFDCATNYTNTTAGAHDVLYPPLFDSRWFFQLAFAGAGPNAMLQVLTPFDLSAASQLLNLAGRFPTLTDLRGTAVQGAAREYGALESDSTVKIRGGVKKSRVFTGGY